MADILGQMFFTCQVGSRQYGWTEQHYIIGAADLPGALIGLQTLATRRVNLLGAGVQLSYMRVSDRLVYRDSQVVQGPVPGFQLQILPPALTLPQVIIPRPSGADVPVSQSEGLYNPNLFGDINVVGEAVQLRCDFPYSALLLRMEGGTTFTARRQLLLRGQPDIVQHTDVDRPNPGPWSAAFAQYITWLTTANAGISWGFRALDTSAANPQAILQSVTWTPPVPPNTIYSPNFVFVIPQPGGGVAPVNWPVGTRVRLRGVLLSDAAGNKLSVNGLWTVATNVNGLVTLYGAGSTQSYPVVIKTGFARPQVYAVIPYTRVLSRRWGSRKTGGPFDRPRGRSRRRRDFGSVRVDP